MGALNIQVPFGQSEVMKEYRTIAFDLDGTLVGHWRLADGTLHTELRPGIERERPGRPKATRGCGRGRWLPASGFFSSLLGCCWLKWFDGDRHRTHAVGERLRWPR